MLKLMFNWKTHQLNLSSRFYVKPVHAGTLDAINGDWNPIFFFKFHFLFQDHEIPNWTWPWTGFRFSTGYENHLRIICESIWWKEKKHLKFLSPFWIARRSFSNSGTQSWVYNDLSNWYCYRGNLTSLCQYYATLPQVLACVATFTTLSTAKCDAKWINGSLALHRCAHIPKPVTIHNINK